MSGKAKVTLSVDEDAYSKARGIAADRGIPVSRLVERYLRFLSNRHVYCFDCGEQFSSVIAPVCVTCGWLKCPHCQACRCELGDEAAQVAYHFRKTLEELVGGRLN